MRLPQVEISIPIVDFFRLKKRWEKLLFILVPIIFGVINYIYILFCIKNCNLNFKINDVFNDYLNLQINVMALFITFSMAYLTILVTSSSKNVDELKTRTSCIYELNKQPVFLYQIILTELTYSIIIEIILLALSFIQKLLLVICSKECIDIFFSIDVILLVHIILILLRNVKNIYFSFWKAR